jgi:hypothetical protein
LEANGTDCIRLSAIVALIYSWKVMKTTPRWPLSSRLG